ncbi:MAG: 30S ribosomal protein S6 [Gemmataceae bacterium]|nr:30S ribosomal protein S6 [Gemmataceae bacterium]
MQTNVYECMLILDTSHLAGNVEELEAQVRALIEKHKGEVLVARTWDDRKLAYPINRSKKGLYYLVYVRANGSAITPIKHDFLLNENILRHLFIKVDPKHVEVMLALAREERPTIMQTVHTEPLEDIGYAPDMRDSRRGGRRFADSRD